MFRVDLVEGYWTESDFFFVAHCSQLTAITRKHSHGTDLSLHLLPQVASYTQRNVLSTCFFPLFLIQQIIWHPFSKGTAYMHDVYICVMSYKSFFHD
jgi:hypothetical protein